MEYVFFSVWVIQAKISPFCSFWLIIGLCSLILVKYSYTFCLENVEIYYSKIDLKIFASDTIFVIAESFYTNKMRIFWKKQNSKCSHLTELWTFPSQEFQTSIKSWILNLYYLLLHGTYNYIFFGGGFINNKKPHDKKVKEGGSRPPFNMGGIKRPCLRGLNKSLVLQFYC